MYSIVWINHMQIVLVGGLNDILGCANLLEKDKTEFRVYSVPRGFACSQNSLGCGGFRYWLNPPEANNT